MLHFSKSFLAAVSLCAAGGSVQADPLTAAQVSDLFSGAQIVSDPVEVDCTLSGGAQSRCIQFTVKPEPVSYVAGPWCPAHVSDGPENAGKWFYDGEFIDADGAFFAALAELYDDPNWQIADPVTGDIRFTDTFESCQLAARPDVAEEYQQNCVQCLLEYMDDDHVITYTIPLEPIEASQPSETNRTGSGVAFNGIRLDGPAPVDAILGAYTIAAFDDCGGHVNPFVGYHYHAVTDCLPHSHADEDGDAVEIHSDVIGIAMDGYFIATHLNSDGSTPEGLDACNGHTTDDLGYHYHAGDEGSNLILGCLSAQAGCVAEGEGGVCDASARPARP